LTTASRAAERRLIVLLAFASFGSAASMRVADAQLPALADAFAISLASAAHVITVFSIAYGVLQLAYGPLGDRQGKWRVITWATFACALTALACALAPDYNGLLVARLLAGASCAAIIPLSMAWIGDAVPYERRQGVLARFLLGQILGMAGGQWIGGLAADFGQWRAPFVALALCFVIAGVAMWRAQADALEAAPLQARSGHLWRESLYVLRQRWARVILAVVFVEGVLLFGLIAFLATHLHLKHGLSLGRAGAIVTLYAAGGVIFALFARRFVQRLGESGLAHAGGALLLIGLLLVALSPVWWTAPLGCLATGLGFYMLHNTLQTNATQMAPEARGAAVSLFACFFFLGQTVGVAVTAVLVERYGSTLVLAAGSLAVGALAAVFAQLRRRRPAH
jgi:predicted MFS family arabinose efflux permease